MAFQTGNASVTPTAVVSGSGANAANAVKGRRNRSANRGSGAEAAHQAAAATSQDWASNNFMFYQNQNNGAQRVTTYGTNGFGVINID